MEPFIISSLFFPIAWRFTLAALGHKCLRGPRGVAVLAIPCVFVAAIDCYYAYVVGPYGFYIPIILAMFWMPQIAFLGFFALCDHEHLNTAGHRTDSRPSTRMKNDRTPHNNTMHRSR